MIFIFQQYYLIIFFFFNLFNIEFFSFFFFFFLSLFFYANIYFGIQGYQEYCMKQNLEFTLSWTQININTFFSISLNAELLPIPSTHLLDFLFIITEVYLQKFKKQTAKFTSFYLEFK